MNTNLESAKKGSFAHLKESARAFSAGEMGVEDFCEAIGGIAVGVALPDSGRSEVYDAAGKLARLDDYIEGSEDFGDSKELALSIIRGMQAAVDDRKVSMALEHKRDAYEENRFLTREELAFAADELGFPTDELPDEVLTAIWRRYRGFPEEA